MNTNTRTRKLVLQVSEEAYQTLQKEAVRIDRHAFNVASEVCESALLALQYKQPNALDDLINTSRSESLSGSTEEAAS